MLLKTRFVLFLTLLLLLGISGYLIINSPSQVLAQVMSGSLQINDIVVDSGGGKATSGSTTLTNTSIGDQFGGSFVNSGNQIICAGHACKKDYDFNPGAQPTLQALVISAGEDAVAAGTYGTSGLRENTQAQTGPEGKNYYNSLSIQPQFSGNANDIELAGAAFIEDKPVAFYTSAGTNPFNQLLTSANLAKGFVVIYAQKNKNLAGGPTARKAPLGCGFNFCANNYYVYSDTTWSGPLGGNNWLVGNSASDKIIRAAGDAVRNDPSKFNPPTKPAFSAQFNRALGNKTWGTYGFAITSSTLEGSFTQAIPIPNAQPPLLPSQVNLQSAASTFYLFNLF